MRNFKYVEVNVYSLLEQREMHISSCQTERPKSFGGRFGATTNHAQKFLLALKEILCVCWYAQGTHMGCQGLILGWHWVKTHAIPTILSLLSWLLIHCLTITRISKLLNVVFIFEWYNKKSFIENAFRIFFKYQSGLQ